MKTFVVTVLVIVIVAVAGALFIAYSGVVDVAADRKDPALMDWFLSTTSDHSVERRAKHIAVPDLSGKDMVREGSEHYREMCVGCHGAPGVEASEVAKGLNPRPPGLASADAPGPAEEFWVVKHGIRMTGMPAFGDTHSDEKIWNIVAFLQQLKGMSAADYAALATQKAAPEGPEGTAGSDEASEHGNG